MMFVIGIVLFALAILISVALHECGHMWVALATGMKVRRYFVGFGPTLWSFRRGETEYGIKAIPAGGFVKIDGMTALEEIDPGDEDRAFFQQPAGKRTVVLCAGSFVHFVIAISLVFGFLAIGGQDPIRTDGIQIGAITKCITADPTGA